MFLPNSVRPAELHKSFHVYAEDTVKAGNSGSLFLHRGKTYLGSKCSLTHFFLIYPVISFFNSFPTTPDEFLLPMWSSAGCMRSQKQKVMKCVIFYLPSSPQHLHNFVVLIWPEIKLHSTLLRQSFCQVLWSNHKMLRISAWFKLNRMSLIMCMA